MFWGFFNIPIVFPELKFLGFFDPDIRFSREFFRDYSVLKTSLCLCDAEPESWDFYAFELELGFMRAQALKPAEVL